MAALSSQKTGPMSANTLGSEDYRFLQDYIYRESGIVLDQDKHYLVDARLSPIARRQNLGTVVDLCRLLRGIHGLEVKRQVVEAMTTNETLFFREPAQYEALRTTVIPKLVAERSANRRLSFWSAASSTGQEIYSLTMMLMEMGLGDWNLKLFATDLNETIIERARQGRYLQIEVNRGLPATHLVKYFRRVDLDWQLKEEVRRLVTFERFDLRQRMSTKGPFDVIFCRNVLIYFDPETKRKIIKEFRNALFRGGYLLVGGAETIMNVEGFRRVEVGGAALYQAE